jgi:hypothetical protein
VAVGRNRKDIISKQKRRDTKDIISFVFNDWGKQMLPEFWDQEKIHCKLIITIQLTYQNKKTALLQQLDA